MRYLQLPMGIGPQLLSQLRESLFEFRPCIRTAHWSFHSEAQGDLLEFLPVLVLAIINCMYYLMNKRVEDFNGLMQGGGDEYLILVVGTTSL